MNSIFALALTILTLAGSFSVCGQDSSPQDEMRSPFQRLSGRYELTRPNIHLGSGVDISRDGRYIAYIGDDSRVHLTDLATNSDRVVVAETPDGMSVFNSPNFSPDGKTLFFSASGGTLSYPSNIYRVSLADGAVQQITSSQLQERSDDQDGKRTYNVYYMNPRVSSDGTELMVEILDGSSSAPSAVGVLDGEGKLTRTVAQGTPLFWKDGQRRVVYEQDGIVKSTDLDTGGEEVLGSAGGRIVGEMDGQAIETTPTSAVVRRDRANVKTSLQIAAVEHMNSQGIKSLYLTILRWSADKKRVLLLYEGDMMERIEVHELKSK